MESTSNETDDHTKTKDLIVKMTRIRASQLVRWTSQKKTPDSHGHEEKEIRKSPAFTNEESKNDNIETTTRSKVKQHSK